MSKCGFCGEKLEPGRSHISPSQCIFAYKKKVSELQEALNESNVRMSQLIVKLQKFEDAKEDTDVREG